MTIFDSMKSNNIDEFAEWLCKYASSDCSPWIQYWDNNYCKKCGWEEDYIWNGYAWCELNGKCKFFKDMDKIPDEKDVIKLWLESECI